MSTSFRNVVKRKVHKERHQPAARARFGLLEKHKDYQLRARDYNSKKERLQILREKAAMRNPDEFYFKMHKGKTRGGVARDTQTNREIDGDTVKLLKSQDRNYLEFKARGERRSIQRLQESLGFMGAAAAGMDGDDSDDGDSDDSFGGNGGGAKAAPRHVVFVDSDDETAGNRRKRARHGGSASDDDDEEDVANTIAASTTPGSRSAAAASRKELNAATRARIAKYNELELRLKREAALRHAIAEKHAERVAQAKGQKRKVVEGTRNQAPIYKFRKERRK